MMSVEQRLEFCRSRIAHYREQANQIEERERRTGRDESPAFLAAVTHHALMEERARELKLSLGVES